MTVILKLSESIYSEVKVHSFEPESNNFQILNENIHLNSLSKKVVAYPFGISNNLSITKLYLSKWTKAGSHNTVGDKVDHNLNELNPIYEQGTLAVSLDELIGKYTKEDIRDKGGEIVLKSGFNLTVLLNASIACTIRLVFL